MQSSFGLAAIMPFALGIIMLGLGLTLTIEDFKRVTRFPKSVLVGLFCQMIFLPICAFFIAKGFDLTGAMAVGFMLLAASPGGATSNLYSHLSNGDVALNITMTALNSVLTLFTLPLIVNFALATFMAGDQEIVMQFKKVIEVFAIVLVPVSIGMLLRRFAPKFADRMEKPVRIGSALFLFLIILLSVLKEWDRIGYYTQLIGFPILVFNLLSLSVGYFFPKLAGVPEKHAVAIGMEIGIHNGTLAIYLATNALNNSEMTIPPALYSILMFMTAALFSIWIRRNLKLRAPSEKLEI
jgi:bile acid:Na+ symporter, BASS family